MILLILELVSKYDDETLINVFSQMLNIPLIIVEDKFDLNKTFGF